MTDDLLAFDREHHVFAVDIDFSSIRLFEQVVDVPSNDVDNVFLERLFFRDSYAFTHRLDRPLRIAAAFLCDAFAKGCGEILDLLTHGTFDFLSRTGYRMRRSDIRSRSHCGNARSHRAQTAR